MSASKPCPICRKPRSEKYAPFCSARCRDRDLAKWFNDGYAVPGRPAFPNELGPDELGPDELGQDD